MIVTIAIDSWKGCLDSLDAAHAIETGLRRVCPDLEARLSPLADGGEGTTCALCTPEERIPCTVTGPLGEPVIALAGSVQPDAPLGEIDAVFPVLRAPMSLADAMDPETARQNIAAAAEQILRLWLRARQ